jgi:hypothetical protein
MSEYIERIEKYLGGAMSVEEKNQFELDMRNDPQLEEAVSRLRIIDSALEISVEDDLRNLLKKLETGTTPNKSVEQRSNIRNLFNRIALAASVLILIGAGLWLLLGRGGSDLEQFSEQEYLSYDYTRIRGDYSLRSDFPVDLSDGKYDKQNAVQWFMTWLKEHPDDDEARFILADVYNKMKQKGKAKEELERIILRHSILFGEKAEWNYVLLSATDTWDTLAESTFQKMIKDPAHSYHRQCLELAGLLNK